MKALFVLSLFFYPTFFWAQTIPDSMGSAGGSLNQVKKDPAAKQASKDVNELRQGMEDLVDEAEIPGKKKIKERQGQKRKDKR